jgi:hypothetical protein
MLLSVPLPRSRDISVSAVTGAISGSVLLAAAVYALFA